MDSLATIFAQAPAGCTEVRLSCRVYFHPPTYILTGWLYWPVGCWQRIEAQAEQPTITQVELDAALARYGWNMDSRPVRRSTLELIYTLKPATGSYPFQLHSKTEGYVERRVQEAAWQRLAGD